MAQARRGDLGARASGGLRSPEGAGQGNASMSRPPAALIERLDYPMFVVTASDGIRHSGCLVGFATQCSIEPYRFVVCLSVENHTYRVAKRSRGLGVHLLGADQLALAALFGHETGDEVDKFSRCRWRRGATGVALLPDCAAWLEGTIEDQVPLGDHVGMVLAPIDGGGGPAGGLLTYSRTAAIEPGHPA